MGGTKEKDGYLSVGITGGIGAGKSVVSEILRSMGYPVYDADSASKKLCDTDEDLRQRLTEAFGTSIYDGSKLKRSALAAIIFNDEAKKKEAEAIIHPVVVEDYRAYVRHVEDKVELLDKPRFDNFLLKPTEEKAKLVFVESAVLLSSPLKEVTQRVVLVRASEKCRVKRVGMRDGVGSDVVNQRIRAQQKEEEMLAQSNFVIENEENSELIPQILELLRFINNE